jgi:hypothetical protein
MPVRPGRDRGQRWCDGRGVTVVGASVAKARSKRGAKARSERGASAVAQERAFQRRAVIPSHWPCGRPGSGGRELGGVVVGNDVMAGTGSGLWQRSV